MNVKIQGGGKNAGVYANTGSSAALMEYLCYVLYSTRKNCLFVPKCKKNILIIHGFSYICNKFFLPVRDENYISLINKISS